MNNETSAKFKHSRIVKQLEPSLFHIVTVKTALYFFREFDIETLETAFAAIQQQNPTASCEYRGNNITLRSSGQKELLSIPEYLRSCLLHTDPEIQQQYLAASDEYGENKFIFTLLTFHRLRESIFYIPGHLRRYVLHAVRGLHQDFNDYLKEHPFIEVDKVDKCSLRLKADGTIDRKKMAQQLVSDISIDIRKRYHIACMYNISEMIPTLWAEMEASGYSETVDPDRTILLFSLSDGSLAPWIQLPPPAGCNRDSIFYPRFSECFRFIQKIDRQSTLAYVEKFLDEDLLQIMRYIVTRKEEKDILKTEARRILLLHLKWPLQSLFLRTAEKMWDFLDVKSFHLLLKELMLLKDLEKEGLKEDYDYGSLFKEFWNKSPSHLKESVKDDPCLNQRINSCFDGKRRKRKANLDEHTF